MRGCHRNTVRVDVRQCQPVCYAHPQGVTLHLGLTVGDGGGKRICYALPESLAVREYQQLSIAKRQALTA